jgi:hypothetical protein
MKYVPVTKLANGYLPVRTWVNPAAVIYFEERLGGRNGTEVPVGTRLYFSESRIDFAGHIDVTETPDEVLRLLRDRPSEPVPSVRQFASDVDADYEQFADFAFGRGQVKDRG